MRARDIFETAERVAVVAGAVTAVAGAAIAISELVDRILGHFTVEVVDRREDDRREDDRREEAKSDA